MNALREECQQLRDELIALRREFHRDPELGLHEYHTAARIERELDRFGIPHERVGETAVVGHLTGNGNGSGLVVLRADIDALPIQETNDVPYRSQTPGMMHACGHDLHTTMLLGTAKTLCHMRDSFAGTVKFIFEPSEDTMPGGARALVAAGVMENPHVDAIFGQHVWGTLDIPYIDVTAGPRMAYSGRFTVDVIGTSSHAATPHLGADAITGAAAIITNLQQYVSRMSNPLDPVVLTIGTISGGNRYNAIANHVTMEGVTRAYFLDKHEEAMRQIVENTAEGLGMKAVLKYAHVVHPVINDDDDLTEIAQKAVVKLFGEETLCHMPAMMGSEDFANYAAEIPAVFGFIGCRDEANGMIYNNHHEKFTVNESLLPKGTALMAQFAVDYLAGNA